MSVSPLSQFAAADSSTKPASTNDSSASLAAYSDRPLCVHHHGDVTVVVYSAPGQEPKRLNHPILPSLHIVLVNEGEEIDGMTAVLASYIGESNGLPSESMTVTPVGSDTYQENPIATDAA